MKPNENRDKHLDELSTKIWNGINLIDPVNNVEPKTQGAKNFKPLTEQRSEILINQNTNSENLIEFNSSGKIRDLSSRFDVINKTLTRALKRYYSVELGASLTLKYNINLVETMELWQKIDEVCSLFHFDSFLL